MSGADPTVVTPAVLRDWPLPEPAAGKGSRGQVVVVGGTAATPGAVLLAGEAALRAGAGKLAVVSVDDVAAELGVALPECAVQGVPADADGSIAATAGPRLVEATDGADAVLVGSGFTDVEASVGLLEEVAAELDGPLVVDAIASAYLTRHPEGLRHLGGNVVLTVNPTELSRTADRDEDEVADDPYDAAREVARRSDVVVLCGGPQKLVVVPDGTAWSIDGGGPGLGISGSGDVQAGIVSGLLARGAEPAQAAVWGAYLHARSGERLASSVSTLGYLARELPGQVPLVLTELA